MSWLNQLYQTYEANIDKNMDKRTEVMLTPVAHMNANAQIEVTINEEGEFCSANVIEKEDAVTLIPVTEASASRSSGVAPHALSDTLSYIAGDFAIYCEKEKDKKNAQNKFSAYMNQLRQWRQSSFSSDVLQIIYQYLEKSRLISDLVLGGWIELDEKKHFVSAKINGTSYEKCIVRFRILKNTGDVIKVWEDKRIIQSYMDYYLSKQDAEKNLCFLSGQNVIVSENHPKGIVSASYGAKLVSANDNQGFTYRGRFQTAQQAYSLGYEASQKIHSALTWLGKKQGVSVGTKDKCTFICWNKADKELPDIFNLFESLEWEELRNDNETENVMNSNPFETLALKEEEPLDDSIQYKRAIKRFVKGYADKFDDMDNVNIIGLEAATTGRLSIVYYNEISAKSFFQRMEEWARTCNWWFPKFENGKIKNEIQTPVFSVIVKRAFGTEKGSDSSSQKKSFIDVNDKILKEQTKRLLKCMMDNQPLPWDIVQALVKKTSNPLSYSKMNRERVLSTACAMITKYYYDKKLYKEGEKNYMKLDTENRDRSYLFGRLLAIYERMERMTYDKEEKREPNAIRLQSAFVNHPMQTWRTLEESINPYLQKLTPASREFFKTLISKITALFQEEDDGKMNQGLKETYLLGYYLQRAELFSDKKEKKEDIIHE